MRIRMKPEWAEGSEWTFSTTAFSSTPLWEMRRRHSRSSSWGQSRNLSVFLSIREPACCSHSRSSFTNRYSRCRGSCIVQQALILLINHLSKELIFNELLCPLSRIPPWSHFLWCLKRLETCRRTPSSPTCTAVYFLYILRFMHNDIISTSHHTAEHGPF